MKCTFCKENAKYIFDITGKIKIRACEKDKYLGAYRQESRIQAYQFEERLKSFEKNIKDFRLTYNT